MGVQPTSTTTEPGAPLRRARVLLVEDDPNVRRSTALLVGEEHDCSAVASAREALDLLDRGERFDLILCDIGMPEMSGVEFYEELARRAPALASSMLFLSGGATDGATNAFLARHDDAVLLKPYQAEALLEKISARLG